MFKIGDIIKRNEYIAICDEDIVPLSMRVEEPYTIIDTKIKNIWYSEGKILIPIKVPVAKISCGIISFNMIKRVDI